MEDTLFVPVVEKDEAKNRRRDFFQFQPSCKKNDDKSY